MKTTAMHNTNYNKESQIGGIIGAILSIKLWLLQTQPIQIAPESFREFLSEWLLKVIGTVILAVVGSALAPLGRDFYKYKMKPRFFKDKKD